MDLTADQLAHLFSDAVRRAGEARKSADAALRAEAQAKEEIEAIRVLGRRFPSLRLEESPDVRRVVVEERAAAVEKAQFDPAEAPIVELMAAYLRRHPEQSPITPSELSAGILKAWNRKVDSASITTTRTRNASVFEKVDAPGKRGAFQLKQQLDAKEKKKPTLI